MLLGEQRRSRPWRCGWAWGAFVSAWRRAPSIRPAPFSEGSVLGRGVPEGTALARAHGLERRSERVACPGLHLHDHQRVAAPAHEVELAAPSEESRADDLVAARPEKLGGRLLPGSA